MLQVSTLDLVKISHWEIRYVFDHAVHKYILDHFRMYFSNYFCTNYFLKEFLIMKKSLVLLLASSMLLIGVNSVCAEDVKGVDIKSIFNSDKAAGNIITVQPGVTLPSAARPIRAVYYITGGDVERIYPDGKIVKKHFKAGDTAYLDSPENMAAHAVKNVGKKEFKAYSK